MKDKYENDDYGFSIITKYGEDVSESALFMTSMSV